MDSNQMLLSNLSDSPQFPVAMPFPSKSLSGVLEPLALPICKVHLLGLLSPTLRDNRVGWVFIAECRLSLVAANGGLLLVAVPGLLIEVDSLVEHGLYSSSSIVVAHGLSCCAADHLCSWDLKTPSGRVIGAYNLQNMEFPCKKSVSAMIPSVSSHLQVLETQLSEHAKMLFSERIVSQREQSEKDYLGARASKKNLILGETHLLRCRCKESKERNKSEYNKGVTALR
ncbi:hypothetical protein MG293_001810 [Ovis ammon polii]|uniref:Uncharacterized protein n=1 Tax=Ovis ammon polii TaxID=230172 RepID=A0AAD4URK9_OVIAM|nr:hypothetical protein MG293_001810 [Ovis ammon polii]